ncbi:MAG: PDZ domain-containing protein [Acidobacteria bacterium]|nr:PDZ domain-containing protein [Acidobacteriota bacterium]
MKQMVSIIAIGLGLMIPLAVFAGSSEPEADQEIRKSLAKIAQVYHLAANYMADPVDPETAIYRGAIRGALASLDPFSVFLDADQFQSLQNQQRGVQQGFGAILSVQAGQVTVLQSLPGSPFGRAGLGPGDRILRINGYRVASLELPNLVQVLQEAKRGRVRLSLLRSGKLVPEDFELDPAEVPHSTVDKEFRIEPEVGYLHVAGMEDETPQKIQSTLQEWGFRNLRGLILDLRDNPGGSLEAATTVAGLFLPKGAKIVRLEGRSVPEIIYEVKSEPPFPNLPLVVILNENTASAAEILAAALQEHDRAWLVGQPSFGKGVAESVLPLSEGAALVLTTARYFTPQGRSIQRPLPGTALAAILEDESRTVYSKKGRVLPQGKGIEPDEVAEPWHLERWMVFLEQSTAFVDFAQSHLEHHGKISGEFEANEAVMEEFRQFLIEAGVHVPARSWSEGWSFLKTRIEVELFNLAFGMARGDEVEMRADPQVQAARGAVKEAQRLLWPSENFLLPLGENKK